MGTPLGPALDPKLPDYAYTTEAVVPVFKAATGQQIVANLFMGEWAKIAAKKIPGKGRVLVHFRGGDGYVDVAKLSRTRLLEIFFIDVGQGDAILIQTPDDRRVLIDGGAGEEALQFLVNKYRLDAADHFVDFEAIVATHCDADHSAGLIPILSHPQIAVKRFYHNGLFRRTVKGQDPGCVQNERIFGLQNVPQGSLTPLMTKLAAAIDKAGKNLPKVLAAMDKQDRWRDRVEPPPGGKFVCARADAATGFLPPFDGTNGGTAPNDRLRIEVIWPCAQISQQGASYRFYEDAGKTVNGNSVVLRVSHGEHTILLTGDLNELAMRDVLAKYGDSLAADVYKAAHHGSQHFDVGFLKAVKPNAAVISSGDDKLDQFGHPRSVLLGTITHFARVDQPAVFSTELAACFSPLAKARAKKMQADGCHLYERSIQGIVHLRSDGKQLYMGTVHGRAQDTRDPLKNLAWKWDVWKA